VPTNTSYRYNIAYEQGKERAMPGGDAEIGYDITPHFTLYGGGYYFDHADAKSIAGPKLRATYTFYRPQAHRLLKLFDRIRLEGLISHDSVRGTSWMAGLRFRFGLSHHSNPTAGVIRHMTDPIRRDLNVVSEDFNNPAEFYNIDGRRARVDLVSSTSGRTIDAAVSGNADVIGVRGTQTATEVLTLGDRYLVITGGAFHFVHRGYRYTIDEVGIHGIIHAAAGKTLFDAIGGTETVTLQYLGLKADSDQFAFMNSTNTSFGHIIMRSTDSNAPILLRLDDTETDSQGQLTFINNTITLLDSTATDPDAGGGNGGLMGLGLLVTGTDNQRLTISNFRNNTIDITNSDSNIDLSLYGMDVESFSNNAVTFINGIKDNQITIENDFTAVDSSTTVEGLHNYQIILNSSFDQNKIDVEGYAGYVDDLACLGNHGDFVISNGDFSNNDFYALALNESSFAWRMEEATSMMITGDFKNNIFTSVSPAVGAAVVGWAQESELTIGGDMRNNTITATRNGASAAGDIYGWDQDGDLIIGGNMNGNHISASDGTEAVGWRIYNTNSDGVVTINGNMVDNYFVASDSRNGTAWSQEFSTSTFILYGDMQGNHFISSNNKKPSMSSGQGWRIAGSITIVGDMVQNYFDTSGNNFSGINMRVIGANTSFILHGNMEQNQFIASYNTGTESFSIHAGGKAIEIDGSMTIEGDVKENRFETSNNDVLGIAIQMNRLSDFVVKGNIVNNTFISLDNGYLGAGFAAGVQNETGLRSLTVMGTVSNNSFLLSSDPTYTPEKYAAMVFENDSITATFSGLIRNNTITVTDESGEAMTSGFDIEVQTDREVRFEDTIQNNLISINGSLTGDYGFNLNTVAGGEIHFEGNSEDDLRSLNNQATINASGSGIFYNG
jgi:hypothetical protein